MRPCQCILSANAIEGIALTNFAEQFLFPHAAATEIHPHAADLVIAFGLFQIAPPVLDIEPDLIFGVFLVTTRPLVLNQGRPIGISFALAIQGQIDSHPGAPRVPVEIENSIGMKMVLIPPGEFMMGITADELDSLFKTLGIPFPYMLFKGRQDIELRKHEAVINEPFFLAANEVTVGQFRKFVEAMEYTTDAESSKKGGWLVHRVGNQVVTEQLPDYIWYSPGFEQTDENPVFYIQYSHARICSIFREAEKQGFKIEDIKKYSFDKLNSKEEMLLINKLMQYPEAVRESAEETAPHKIADYLIKLANSFHRFYTENRVLGVEKEITESRLALIHCTQIVLRNGLDLVGISSPERM